jgi:hypothetical protein
VYYPHWYQTYINTVHLYLITISKFFPYYLHHKHHTHRNAKTVCVCVRVCACARARTHVNACIYTEIYDKLFKYVKSVISEKNHFARETRHSKRLIPSRKHMSLHCMVQVQLCILTISLNSLFQMWLCSGHDTGCSLQYTWPTCSIPPHIATWLSLRPMAIFEGQLGHNSIYL